LVGLFLHAGTDAAMANASASCSPRTMDAPADTGPMAPAGAAPRDGDVDARRDEVPPFERSATHQDRPSATADGKPCNAALLREISAELMAERESQDRGRHGTGVVAVPTAAPPRSCEGTDSEQSDTMPTDRQSPGVSRIRHVEVCPEGFLVSAEWEGDGDCVMEVNASSSIDHQMSLHSSPPTLTGASSCGVSERGPVSLKGPHDSLLHGESMVSSAVGFVDRGPFWTCKTRPDVRRPQTGDNSPSDAAPKGSGVAGVAADNQIPTHWLSRVCSRLICPDFFRNPIGLPTDVEPPAEELTMIALQTKEQRLEWRDFLSQAISTSCALELFTAYDVDASPPLYVRPYFSSLRDEAEVSPVTANCNASGGGKMPILLPRLVAPRGAGLSPICIRPQNKGCGFQNELEPTRVEHAESTQQADSGAPLLTSNASSQRPHTEHQDASASRCEGRGSPTKLRPPPAG